MTNFHAMARLVSDANARHSRQADVVLLAGAYFTRLGPVALFCATTRSSGLGRLYTVHHEGRDGQACVRYQGHGHIGHAGPSCRATAPQYVKALLALAWTVARQDVARIGRSLSVALNISRLRLARLKAPQEAFKAAQEARKRARLASQGQAAQLRQEARQLARKALGPGRSSYRQRREAFKAAQAQLRATREAFLQARQPLRQALLQARQEGPQAVALARQALASQETPKAPQEAPRVTQARQAIQAILTPWEARREKARQARLAALLRYVAILGRGAYVPKACSASQLLAYRISNPNAQEG